MLELFVIGIPFGLSIGAGIGLSFYGCIVVADWWHSSRPLCTEAREIVRMHGWEEPR